jgi:hypothetical protein
MILRILNHRGVLHIGTIIFILALIGAWFVYKSYKENRLQENLSMVLEDYKELLLSKIKDPEDRAKLEQSFMVIQNILSKYSKESSFSY